ncbi:MAG: tRNA-dihydrouridine synthase family protein [Clostridiales bacterium]|nr:tRNA-dihydrouridine synthase family protein [Clostridiales bacterium]
MKFYFAPLEGIAGYIYRNAYHTFFPYIDKYFTPFLSPNQNRALNPKEIRDVLPEHNRGMHVVPQILTNNAERFIRAARELKEKYGYEEVNLNLGCPSATVVTKGKGAGFLAKPEELNAFLEEVFEEVDSKISIKTRIGKDAPEELYKLIEVFNKYPLHELIIHPRVQADYYNNKPNKEMFAYAVRSSKNPLCYNGDIVTKQDYERFCEEFPGIGCVMLGRGLLRTPALIGRIKENKEMDKETLKAFHDRLYADYKESFSGDVNLLFKMKELWFYMIHMFPDNEKYAKKIKKASRLRDYEEIIDHLFREREII